MKISVDMKKSKKKQAIEMVEIDELKRRAIVYIAY